MGYEYVKGRMFVTINNDTAANACSYWHTVSLKMKLMCFNMVGEFFEQ